MIGPGSTGLQIFHLSFFSGHICFVVSCFFALQITFPKVKRDEMRDISLRDFTEQTRLSFRHDIKYRYEIHCKENRKDVSSEKIALKFTEK